MTEAGAQTAAHAIINELTNRKGLRHVIDNLDDEILTEIPDAIAAIIIAQAQKEPPHHGT